MSRLLVARARRLGLRIDEQCFGDRSRSVHSSRQVCAATAAAKAEEKKSPDAGGAEAAAKDSPPKEARVPSENVMRLVKELTELSLFDFADLTEQLKLRLGLDHANISVPLMMPAGMAMPGMIPGAGAAAAPGAGAAAAPAAEEKPVEKQVFDIKLEKYEAADKIKVIKEVRAFTGLGLKEAKELVEKLPAIVKTSLTKDEATKILEKLKAAGGTAIME